MKFFGKSGKKERTKRSAPKMGERLAAFGAVESKC